MVASRTLRLWLLGALALGLLSASLLVYSRVADQRVNRGQRQSMGAGHPEDLTWAFLHAVEALRLHQTAAGYWTTPVTRGPAFEQPLTEVNVFVPALILDVLEPVAQETSLTDVLERTRGYLRDQIEETGLVRYHGKPAHLGTLQPGCELPPDADDTALVWRLASKDEQTLLESARRELAHYRTAAGLYQTWLADQETYQCFYTYAGHDPNPADVGVQMHLYLFFAQYDQEAARQLCAALRQQMSEPRLWVWYTVAPLVPLWREGELTRAGCAVQVPASRIQEATPGQDIYLTLSQLFQNLLLHPEPRPVLQPALQALQDVAAGQFLRLSQAPPLLYHNDLSAVPPHFHWSEDVGYALWLRLYVEVARHWPGSLPLPTPSTKAP